MSFVVEAPSSSTTAAVFLPFLPIFWQVYFSVFLLLLLLLAVFKNNEFWSFFVNSELLAMAAKSLTLTNQSKVAQNLGSDTTLM